MDSKHKRERYGTTVKCLAQMIGSWNSFQLVGFFDVFGPVDRAEYTQWAEKLHSQSILDRTIWPFQVLQFGFERMHLNVVNKVVLDTVIEKAVVWG